MRTFELRLQDATRAQAIGGVRSFVGRDRSGSFGILAGHARMMTVLSFGLARFRRAEEDWRFLAIPGAVLYFRDDVLTLTTRHFLVDEDYTRICDAMSDQLVAEEKELQASKESLRRLEREVLKRMWRLGRGA
jgi:F-type H+-transporting ATPase subunit epsilon